MAASITFVQGFKDLFTCSVCFENFNNEGRKPKFLSCYHTLCLECIKAMTSRLMVVMCPICRKETRLNANDKFELPNNHYILEMMTGSKSPSKPAVQLGSPQPVKELWCMKCRKEPSNLCSLLSGHSIISLGEYCSELHCLELQKIMDNNESQLRNIIEKRMEAKTNYSLVYTALKVMEDEVRKLEDDNDLRVVEMVSLLDRTETVTEKEENVHSLARKVQKETETVKKELTDFMGLEESFLSIIRGIRMPIHSVNAGRGTQSSSIPRFGEGLHPIEGQIENKITFPMASEIVLTLIKSGVVKSNEIKNSVQNPLPKPNLSPNPKPYQPAQPNPNPKPRGFLRWIDATSKLDTLPLETASTSNNSNNCPSSIPKVMPSSREIQQAQNEDAQFYHNSFISTPLLQPSRPNRSLDNVQQRKPEPSHPPPVPPRNTSSLSPFQSPFPHMLASTDPSAMQIPYPDPNASLPWIFPSGWNA